MFVHVKYGNECGDRVMEFTSNHIITVDDVIGKAIIIIHTLFVLGVQKNSRVVNINEK